MKRISTLLAAVTLGVATTGCSSDLQVAPPSSTSQPTPATAPEPSTTSTPATAGEDELSALLLDAADFGPAWVPETDVGVADFTSLGELPCPDTAINPTIVARLMPTEAAIFTNPDAAIIEGAQELLLTGDPARLAADLDILFEGAQMCLGAEWVDDDGERVLYEPFDVPAVGDQRLAGRLTVTEPDGATTWRGWSAIVRVGTVAMMLNVFEILPTPDAVPTISDEAFVTLLQTAVDRLGTGG